MYVAMLERELMDLAELVVRKYNDALLSRVTFFNQNVESVIVIDNFNISIQNGAFFNNNLKVLVYLLAIRLDFNSF